MNRITLLFTLASVVATMVAVGAISSALAQTTVTCTEPAGTPREFVCTTTTIEQRTEERTTQLPDEFVETQLPNETERTPGTGPCDVGNSNRVGTAEGLNIQEFAVTSTQRYTVTSKQTWLITTTTTSAQRYRGGNNNNRTNPQGDPVVVGPTEAEVPQGTPTITKTPAGDPVIDRTLIREDFTPTGRCENVSGPQNEEAVENANPRALEPRPRGNQPGEELPVETPVDEPRGNRPADTPRGNQPIDLPRGGQPEEWIEEVLPVVDSIEEIL